MRYPEDSPNWVDPSKPPRTCQVPGCGVTRPLDQMIHGHLSVTVPGDEYKGKIPPFQCADEEHWACSIEHFTQIQHACLDEHIKQALIQIHSQIPESVHHDEANSHIIEANG